MSEELNGFEGDFNDGDDTSGTTGRVASLQGASQNASQIVTAGADNTVVLPAGQAIESLEFDGRDLVIILSDGSRIVVPDGAIVIPQLVIDGTPIPPANVAALLVGNEPEPAAGLVPSSGGNFATDPGEIQSAFDLGDLLPYTELPQDEQPEEEIIPDRNDEEPDIVIETPDNPVGVSDAIATVFEEGLPARTNPAEPEGSNAEGNGETTSGTIIFNAQDGLSAILINGVEITTVGQTFTSPIGTLTITSIDIATGEIGFSYTLQDNTLAEEFDGFFEATVIDTDGDQASATLQIRVVDDAPEGVDDAGTVPGGTFGPITGNVLNNDISGADGFDGVTGFANEGGSAEPGETLVGTYGVLTLNADGSYEYVRNPNTPGGVEEAFDYDLVDQDGSTSSAVLTITIEDAPTEITFIPEVGEGTIVDEGGLPPRGDDPVGTGEIADNDPDNNSDTSETTGATVTFNSPDGLGSIAVNGVTIDQNNLPQTVVSDGTGTLVITDVTYDPATGDGTITYEYTLGDNTSGDDTSVDFEITVTDLDGDSASDTLTIHIVDDEPIAVDDTGMAGDDENAPITVDVFANDTPGADGVALDDIAFVEGSLQGGGSVSYNGDGTFTYTPAPGEEGEVSFDYSITDGDGDVATATVTITLADDSEPQIAVEGDDDVDEAGLPARDGEPEGSDSASDSEIAQGDIAISTGNDTLASLVINGQDVTGGGTVTTAKGTLSVSVTGGQYSYTYTLTDNTLSDPDSDTFTLVATDSDGDTASTSLVIAIADDTPSAADDAAAIAAGEYGPVGGSVLANDTQGADGALVTAYSGAGGSGAAGDVVQGEYGTLTIAADGTFSYTRDAGTPGGVSDTFSYTITDGDGDVATADLVISIADSPTDLDLPVAGEDGTVVDEAGLDGPPAGSAAGTDGEFTSGTFTFSAPDGPAVVTIDGVAVTGAGQTFAGAFGTLTINSVSGGVIAYTYELTTSTDGDNTSDSFAVVVTDQDGDFSDGTLSIAILDDVPTANPDVDSVTEDGPLSATGNVITATDPAPGDANATDGVEDVTGADGAMVSGVAAGQAAGDVSGNVGTSVTGTYGSITILANGDYEYVLDNQNAAVQGLDGTESLSEVFTYTLTDGDGDTSTTTVTVTINGADDPVVLTGFNLEGAEEVVDEDDLADGSSPDSGALTQAGSFDVTSVDGLDTLTIDGTAIFGGGVTYPVTITGSYGTLVVTGVATTLDSTGDVVAATVSYEYTLADNTVDHSVSGEDRVTDSFSVQATDTDGSVANDVLDVDIIDDVPTANDDSGGQVSENQAFTIDALANDVFGADGVDTSDVADVYVSTQATYGTVTYNPVTGLFTYTPAPGAGSNGNLTDSFEYTIVDGDGDMSTATVNVTLQPDSEPQGGQASAAVDDDGLTGGNPASTDGDLDANAGDDPLDTSEASFTGNLVVSVGNDTPASVSFAAGVDGSTASVGTETVTYSVV
ncbi:beta strand repeat-containing protein, partial [Aurantiacibacter odishensis]|uniref:beta strand repeat-containing protein n=1 Tax=Aurantiacibacter odishensis TaxID=1155476 RepID=UPI000E731693